MHNEMQLKWGTTTPIRMVNEAIIHNVWLNFENRFHAVTQELGGCLEENTHTTKLKLSDFSFSAIQNNLSYFCYHEIH